ncbi:histidine phosphatase family protein [Paenibacillus sp. MBLB4367]|uniref:histidine phosphatase family protein n=1 Tax=Paenibacillus sp. MBLB4367 TaxID=3384767 RepID=UPI0039082987
MTIIGFVRHGVTDWNLEGRAQGSHDVPLNEAGLKQAEQVARRLASEKWDYIYASDLSRASRTAAIIAEAKKIEVTGHDIRLREKTHGRLDGTTEQERIEKWGSGWRELDHDEEPLEEVLGRGLQAVHEIARKHEGSRILVVSHGAWIRTILSGLVKNIEITPLHNTSISVVRQSKEQAEGEWACTLYNCTEHLEA